MSDIVQTTNKGTNVIRSRFGGDQRLAATDDHIQSKRDKAGRWKLEYHYTGTTWADIEEKGNPNKWVTLRALLVLKGGGIEA